MIEHFQTKTAQDIYDGINSRAARKIPVALHAKIRRLFDQLNVILSLDMLRKPPSNHLEKLKGKAKEFWSLRINKQWRIVFKWDEKNCLATEVDVVDYH